MSISRINSLIKIYNANIYLEIGLYEARNFSQINIPYKVGVDPVFYFNPEDLGGDGICLFKMPSDDFLQQSITLPPQ